MMLSSALTYGEIYQPDPALPMARFGLTPFPERQIRQFTRPLDRKLEPMDLGLRAGAKVIWKPDDSGNLPENFMFVVTAIKQFERLKPNWDSYGALPLDDRAVVPALELAIEGVKRCFAPTAVPLCTGGLGLRWKCDEAELEIDIGPTGAASALLEIFATYEIVEKEDAENPSELFSLIQRYCSAAA